MFAPLDVCVYTINPLHIFWLDPSAVLQWITFCTLGTVLKKIKTVCWVRPNPPSTHDSMKLPQWKRQVSWSLLFVASLKLDFSPDQHLEWGKLWPKPWSGWVLRLAFFFLLSTQFFCTSNALTFVLRLSTLQRLGNSRPIKGINVCRAQHIYRVVLIITCCIYASHYNSAPLKDAQILCLMK